MRVFVEECVASDATVRSRSSNEGVTRYNFDRERARDPVLLDRDGLIRANRRIEPVEFDPNRKCLCLTVHSSLTKLQDRKLHMKDCSTSSPTRAFLFRHETADIYSISDWQHDSYVPGTKNQTRSPKS